MRYAIPRGARRAPVQDSSMHRSITPAPDSKRGKPTEPPGSADDGAREYELALVELGEQETRLQYLARVCGVPAIK